MTKSTEYTQLEQASQVLIRLSANVTTKDRAAAMKHFALSRITIGAYLKGEGKDLDTAIELIKYFKKRIDERGLHLSSL